MSTAKQGARFLFVGLINTCFGYVMYAGTFFIAGNITVSLAVATVLGILFNFKTTGLIVFKNNSNKKFLRFVLVYALVLLLNLIALQSLVNFGWGEYLAQFVLLPIFAVLSFVFSKVFVFTEESESRI